MEKKLVSIVLIILIFISFLSLIVIWKINKSISYKIEQKKEQTANVGLYILPTSKNTGNQNETG